MAEPTCGVLYLETMDEFCKTDAECRAFATGHVSGQAEKVYLGACLGAMFRPQPENLDWLLEVVTRIADRYGLIVRVLPYSVDGEVTREIWIAKHKDHLGSWLNFPVNSATWHSERGRVCGVPLSEIDPRFHERRGFNGPCDGKIDASEMTSSTVAATNPS